MTLRIRAIVLGLLALLLVAGMLYLSGTITNANQTDEKAIEQLVDDYLEAIQNKDVDAVMKLVIDKTYPTLEAQREGYQEMLLTDEYYSADVKSIQKVDDNKYSANVVVKNKYTGNFEVMLDVVNEKSGWKILIEKTYDVQPDVETQEKKNNNKF